MSVMNTKPTALDVYLAKTAAIQAKPAQLQQIADDHDTLANNNHAFSRYKGKLLTLPGVI